MWKLVLFKENLLQKGIFRAKIHFDIAEELL